jgi:hypothetical protein
LYIERGFLQKAPLDLLSALFDLDIAGGGRQREAYSYWLACIHRCDLRVW